MKMIWKTLSLMMRGAITGRWEFMELSRNMKQLDGSFMRSQKLYSIRYSSQYYLSKKPIKSKRV